MSKESNPITTNTILRDLRELIFSARQEVARTVNSTLVMLYWQIGKRINQEILKGKRADYGKQIVQTLSVQLTREYGKGYTRDNLFRMIQFVQKYPNKKIVGALSRQLTWTHFVQLLPLEDSLKRDFYSEMGRIERWSTRTLEKKIKSMLYERTAISRKPKQLIKQEIAMLRKEDKLTPDLVFRDPYLLDFLGLKNTYAEKDLEAAILKELEQFILEIGTDFSFIARQKRITIDKKDYYIDLLFYHRSLRRLVAIELKLEEFEASHKGQIELYLRWLERYEMQDNENPPLGLILCAGKSEEQIELLQMGKSGIRVATYLTDLPPRKLLQKKLHEATVLARKRLG